MTLTKFFTPKNDEETLKQALQSESVPHNHNVLGVDEKNKKIISFKLPQSAFANQDSLTLAYNFAEKNLKRPSSKKLDYNLYTKYKQKLTRVEERACAIKLIQKDKSQWFKKNITTRASQKTHNALLILKDKDNEGNYTDQYAVSTEINLACVGYQGYLTSKFEYALAIRASAEIKKDEETLKQCKENYSTYFVSVN